MGPLFIFRFVYVIRLFSFVQKSDLEIHILSLRPFSTGSKTFAAVGGSLAVRDIQVRSNVRFERRRLHQYLLFKTFATILWGVSSWPIAWNSTGSNPMYLHFPLTVRIYPSFIPYSLYYRTYLLFSLLVCCFVLHMYDIFATERKTNINQSSSWFVCVCSVSRFSICLFHLSSFRSMHNHWFCFLILKGL